MSARRQSSTTSLAKFAHAHPEPPGDPSGLDFCNAFWGQGDAGYDVLLARMRGAVRTVEELNQYFKERALLEAEYANRLTKLAKLTLGRDEIGELRSALDVLKTETEKQASAHQELAIRLRQEMEMPTTTFMTRQISHKKTVQATIEKAFKNKQMQEGYAQKAREKYESDCLKINSYTAQQSLLQGKDLEKLRLKLEKTQSTIAGSEREYQQFTKALADTTRKWETDWKSFCDGCQDLEEDRIEFTRDTVWAYANAVSTVCVADDECCEQVRVGLENIEVDRDMENFVVSYGTGSFIPDPPKFVDYGPGGMGESQSNNRRGREARFPRVSKKGEYPTGPPPDFDADAQRATSIRSTSRANTPLRESPAPVPPYPTASNNGGLPPTTTSGPYNSYGAAPPVSKTGEPVMLDIRGHAYPVDPSADPQRPTSRQPSISGSVTTATSQALATPGDANDPLARAMNELRQNSIKRGSPSRHGTLAETHVISPTSAASTGSHYSQGTSFGLSKLSSPPQPPQPINYDSISASIVGGPPPGSQVSPPASAPRAAFMDPPTLGNPALPVDEVLSTYGQSFPEERSERRLSSSRPGSRMSQQQVPPPQQQGQQNLQRPVSPAREGFAGIGARGRSPSPQFMRPPDRAPSQSSVSRYGRPVSPAPSGNLHRPVSPAGRPVSPSAAGIALDDRGRVVQDSLAEDYERKRREEEERHRQEEERQRRMRDEEERQRRMRDEEERQRRLREEEELRLKRLREEEERVMRLREEEERIRRVREEEETRLRRVREEEERRRQQQAQQAPYYNAAPPQGYPQAPNPNHPYQAPSPNNGYPQPPVQVPPPQQGYVPKPNQYVPPQPPQNYQQPPQQAPYRNYPGYPPESQAQPAPVPQQPPKQLPPTMSWTSTGEGILFYVKALYDYKASVEEEFDFQSGDIIAVTATPEDGWWSGELLDDQRRQPGKTIFPSNFVCLF